MQDQNSWSRGTGPCSTHPTLKGKGLFLFQDPCLGQDKAQSEPLLKSAILASAARHGHSEVTSSGKAVPGRRFLVAFAFVVLAKWPHNLRSGGGSDAVAQGSTVTFRG